MEEKENRNDLLSDKSTANNDVDFCSFYYRAVKRLLDIDSKENVSYLYRYAKIFHEYYDFFCQVRPAPEDRDDAIIKLLRSSLYYKLMYVYKNATLLSSAIAFHFWNVYKQNPNVLEKLIKKKIVKICSIGGSSAPDIVAVITVLKSIALKNNIELDFRVTVIDFNKDWKNTCITVLRCLEEFCEGTWKINFIRSNLANTNAWTPETLKAIQEADIITMVKFISKYDNKKNIVEMICDEIKSEAIFFVLDHPVTRLIELFLSICDLGGLYLIDVELCDCHTLELEAVKQLRTLYQKHFGNEKLLRSNVSCNLFVSVWLKASSETDTKLKDNLECVFQTNTEKFNPKQTFLSNPAFTKWEKLFTKRSNQLVGAQKGSRNMCRRKREKEAIYLGNLFMRKKAWIHFKINIVAVITVLKSISVNIGIELDFRVTIIDSCTDWKNTCITLLSCLEEFEKATWKINFIQSNLADKGRWTPEMLTAIQEADVITLMICDESQTQAMLFILDHTVTSQVKIYFECAHLDNFHLIHVELCDCHTLDFEAVRHLRNLYQKHFGLDKHLRSNVVFNKFVSVWVRASPETDAKHKENMQSIFQNNAEKYNPKQDYLSTNDLTKWKNVLTKEKAAAGWNTKGIKKLVRKEEGKRSNMFGEFIRQEKRVHTLQKQLSTEVQSAENDNDDEVSETNEDSLERYLVQKRQYALIKKSAYFSSLRSNNAVAFHFRNIYKQSPKNIKRLVKKRLVKICSLGGGSASDIVAIVTVLESIALESDIELDFRVTIIESDERWKITCLIILSCLKAFHKATWKITFIHGNLAKEDSWIPNCCKAIQEADIITMVRFISTCNLVEKNIKDICERMQPRTLLFVLDHPIKEVIDLSFGVTDSNDFELIYNELWEFHPLDIEAVKHFQTLFQKHFGDQKHFRLNTSFNLFVSVWIKTSTESHRKYEDKIKCIFRNNVEKYNPRQSSLSSNAVTKWKNLFTKQKEAAGWNAKGIRKFVQVGKEKRNCLLVELIDEKKKLDILQNDLLSKLLSLDKEKKELKEIDEESLKKYLIQKSNYSFKKRTVYYSSFH
ncbi:hypothetical protein HNY73_016175 [Argiope bruennichi]|uniref:Uncharacterized protein n=1 Tax=Argiope bruennichi TaxID=94029 RepID=A0A8T0EIW6_ARGBR|nr:hypothetical protein HNY73_016175 [Argiope bruennichi]